MTGQFLICRGGLQQDLKTPHGEVGQQPVAGGVVAGGVGQQPVKQNTMCRHIATFKHGTSIQPIQNHQRG